MKPHNLTYTRYGIGNRFPGGCIELHRKLKTPFYLPLHNEILKHELKHTDKGFTYEDLIHDLSWLKHKRLWWKFVLTTPSSWIQFFPLYPHNKKIHIDVNLIILWIISLSLALVVFKLLF